MRQIESIVDGQKLFDKIDSSRGECWEWTACKNKAGYGVVFFSGKSHLAHRVVFRAFRGLFDSSLCVLHSCDNPGCVNPDHLRLGSRKDNAVDREQRNPGTQPRGDKSGVATLSEKKVANIKRDLVSGKYKRIELAKMYHTTKYTIYDIEHGRAWGYIDA